MHVTFFQKFLARACNSCMFILVEMYCNAVETTCKSYMHARATTYMHVHATFFDTILQSENKVACFNIELSIKCCMFFLVEMY